MAEKLETGIRKEQIAQAALGLIAQHGLRRANVAAVARRVGLVPSAIYRHFGSKEAVVEAVLELVHERLMQNVREVTTDTADAFERLERLVGRHVALIRENKGILRVVFSEEVQGHGRRTKVFRAVDAYLRALADIVRGGQRQGTIRRDVDPDTVALMVLGIIQPAALLWHMSGGKLDIDRHARAALAIVRKSIATF